ncbi:MAG: hypothetical protein QGH66_05700, partial [Dehalococcoidia bacterium]|nr:hypothetical protein [Dehalococcoidia bacterium]
MGQGLDGAEVTARLKQFHEAQLILLLLPAGDGFNLEEELWLDYYEQDGHRSDGVLQAAGDETGL